MNKDEKIVKLKIDIIFKRVFGNEQNEEIIAAFISDMLDIPRNRITHVEIKNVELLPEEIDQKFSRLDLNLIVDGRKVNIEMQVNKEAAYKERTLFYWAKLYSEDLESGADYSELSQTICVNIINFNLFDCENYHSHFLLKEKERDEIMTDKLAIHFFELKKVGKFKKNKRMEDWLTLINAETEGDLMALQQSTTIPEIQKTIVILREMSADEQIREEARRREKRLHDEATALGHAKREGIEEGRAEGEAIGEARGRAEGKSQRDTELAEMWRKKGFTEEQIKDLLGENYTG
mgnify:FL=1